MSVAATLFLGLAAIVVVAVVGWLFSLRTGRVSFVDVLWPLFFLLATIVYAACLPEPGGYSIAVIGLVTLWSLRLSAHIGYRNHGKGEDPRYVKIRNNNQPRFRLRSLYIVFLLQGALAWIISFPLLFAVQGELSGSAVQVLACLVWLVGFVFEAGGDWQLARFRAAPGTGGKVLDSGLWRYTRHPNYFGDACIWWAYWLFAVDNGGAWTILSPLLMTFLLLKVSGVALLERDIGGRRPAYADYVRRTSAFVPWPPKPESRAEPNT